MKYKSLLIIFITFFILNSPLFAQDNDFQSVVDYKVEKMKKELNLTENQAIAVRPIVSNYLTKKHAILQEVAGQGIVDHVAVKSTLKALETQENEQLSKILSEDQMKKWINKENLMAALNPDSTESTVDEDSTITMEGAQMKF